MARKEYNILNRKEGNRNGTGRYEVIKGSLDGNPAFYELVTQLEDNCGNVTVYRDNRTGSTVSVEVYNDDDSRLILVGEESQLEKALKDLESTVPKIFKFEEAKEGESK